MNRVAPDGTPESSPPSSRSEGEERVVRNISAEAFLAAGPAKRVPATEAARKKKAAASRRNGGRMAHASLGPRQRKRKLSAFLFPGASVLQWRENYAPEAAKVHGGG